MEGQEASILIGILGAETPDVVSGVPELDATIKRGSIPLSSFIKFCGLSEKGGLKTERPYLNYKCNIGFLTYF